MNCINVCRVWALDCCPRKLSLGAQTLCMIILLMFVPHDARADCPAAPIANTNDMVISFLASKGVQAASGSLLASTVKEGMLIYDDTANKLKLCDGTNWVNVGSGSGTDALAALSCTNGQIAKYNGTVWTCAADNVGSDTLSGLSCSNGQVPKYNGSAWVCATDNGGMPSGAGSGEVQVNTGGNFAVVSNFSAATTSTTISSSTCPSGYLITGGGCYRVITTAKTRANALTDCQSDGGSLAKIDSSGENSTVYSLMTADSWIGANDIASEGAWVWADGSALAYNNWNTGEPNDAGGTQDCGVIYFSTAPQKWDDDNCALTKQAICEATPTGGGGAGANINYIKMPGMSLAESAITGGEACSSGLDGIIIRRLGSLYICDYAGGGWRKLQLGNPFSQKSGTGYFVATQATYNGNLGGFSGANAKCLTDLTNNSWKGKEDAQFRNLLTAAKVRAFLCNGASCQNALPSTTYYFATASGSGAASGFASDASGLGTNEAASWVGSTRLGTPDGYGSYYFNATYFWSGRSTGTNTQWPNTSDANNCSGWTATTGNGRAGYPAFTNTGRWSYTNTACTGLYPLICFVDP